MASHYHMDQDAQFARTSGYAGKEIRLYGQQTPVFDGTTMNRQDYVAHPLEPRPQAMGTIRGPSLPFDGHSTYAQEYPAHPLPERTSRPAYEYRPSPAAFDGSTTYKSNFIVHQFDRTDEHTQRIPAERVSLPFDGTTSYRQDYPVHQLPERQVAAGGPYSPHKVPFEGASTYKGDFKQHAIEPRPMPQAGTIRQSLPFDGSTTYGEYFRPFPIQEYAGTGQRPQQFTMTSGAKFEGVSESMDRYRAWAIDPANRQAGGPPAMRPSLPFDGTTTNREMFKGWQLPPKRPALGVQMVGDTAYVLIPANSSIPAVGRQIFTTVHDNQQDMRVLVLEGDLSQASRCNLLGHFDLTGLPMGPRGSAKVEVAFHIDGNGVMNVTARDLNSQRQEQWLRDGYLVAHVNHN